MSVISISRDWGVEPSIVRMVVDDTLTEITTSGYLTDPDIAADIIALNSGEFTWLDTDVILIKYDVNWDFFYRDSSTDAFVGLPGPGGISSTLPSGEIIVGNGANVATAVALSGDATMANTGAMTIANNAVTSAKLAPTALKYLAVPLTAAEFNGMYGAPKLLIAAGGANTLIVVERMMLLMTFVSAAYAAGGVVAAQYDSTIHGAGVLATNTQQASDFQAGASDAFQFNGASGNDSDALFTAAVNKGIYLSNQTAAFTTGDSTWVAHIWYKIIPTV